MSHLALVGRSSSHFTRTAWAFWASLAIAGATAPAAGCSSSSSGDAGTGSADAEAETGASSGSGGGATDAPEDQNAVGDGGSSSGESSSSSGSGGGDSSGSSGAGDATPDNSSCDLANTCTGATCCPRTSGSCPPFTLTASTVSDSSTGLTWERNFDTVADYSDSVTACTSWGGRLPTESELTNYLASRTSCTAQGILWAIPESSACLWSSTAYDGGGAHQCVARNSAQTTIVPDGDAHYALCVK